MDLQKCKGLGRAKGKVEKDEEDLKTMQTLGPNMAWPLKRGQHLKALHRRVTGTPW